MTQRPSSRPAHLELGARERQIMEAVYRLGEATVGDVREELADPPSYSTIRAMMGKLEAKGRLKHRSDGPRYVYSAAVPREDAQRSVLTRVVDSLFDGSTERTMAAILDLNGEELDAGELERLQKRLAELRKKRS